MADSEFVDAPIEKYSPQISVNISTQLSVEINRLALPHGLNNPVNCFVPWIETVADSEFVDAPIEKYSPQISVNISTQLSVEINRLALPHGLNNPVTEAESSYKPINYVDTKSNLLLNGRDPK